MKNALLAMVFLFEIIIVLSSILCIFVTTNFAYSHPGRTDSSGGHTCRTNCDSWGLGYGEYHYHNGSTSSGIDHAQEFIDASFAGKAHANSVNLSYIQSRASQDARLTGYEDGQKNKIKTTFFYGLGNDTCSAPVVFTSTPTDYYRRTFQNYYETACNSVYESKYKTVYTEWYNSGKAFYDNEQAKISEEKKASSNRDTLIGWIIGISIIGLIAYFTRDS